MTNPQHLQLLKQGVTAWNQWREQNSDIRPDLGQADLTGANLELYNLTNANLDQANLAGADLRL